MNHIVCMLFLLFSIKNCFPFYFVLCLVSSVYHTCDSRDEQSSSEATTNTITVYDDLDEFERNLPPTVTLLENQFGSKV